MVPEKLFEIRDDNDYIILHTAIIEDIDILITGDKDFAAVDIERPEILSPSEYLAKY
jgi:predicted nucleic acid-binding protein